MNWVHCFVHERHTYHLSAYWLWPLESVHGQSATPFNVRIFHDVVEWENDNCGGFEPQNIYGGDKSGLMSGVTQMERVIGGKGKKIQNQK